MRNEDKARKNLMRLMKVWFIGGSVILIVIGLLSYFLGVFTNDKVISVLLLCFGVLWLASWFIVKKVLKPYIPEIVEYM